MKDLVGIVDLKNIVRWRNEHPEDEEYLEERETDIKNTEINDIEETEENKKLLTESKPTIQQMLSAHATPILKDNADRDLMSDDPKNQLWSKPHTIETLKQV